MSDLEACAKAVEEWHRKQFSSPVGSVMTTVTMGISVAERALRETIARVLADADLTDAVLSTYDVPVLLERAFQENAHGIHDACDQLEGALSKLDDPEAAQPSFAAACRALADGDEKSQKDFLVEICWQLFHRPPAYAR